MGRRYKGFWTLAGILALIAAGCRGDSTASLGDIVEARSLGAVYLRENRLPEAEEAYQRLIRLAPDDVAARTNLAVVYLRMNRPDDAEEQAREAIERDSTNVDARLLLANAQEMSGNTQAARTGLEQLTDKPPVDPKIYYALAELARSNPDSAAANSAGRAALRKLVERDPASVPAHLELAQLLVAAGQADSALAQLEKLEQLPPAIPREARPSFHRAVDALRAQKPDEAAEALGEFHRFLEVTSTFQAGLDELRGPQISLAGVPDLTAPPLELIRERMGRDSSSAADVSFSDRTSLLPTVGAGTGAAALAVGDYDGDGSEDLFVSAGDSARAKLIRWHEAAWTDAAADAGVEVVGANAANFADFDNDGHLDLYVVDARGAGHLFMNDGKAHFSEAADKAGLSRPGPTSTIVVADLDHDGDLDLLLGTQSGARFYRNNADGTFADMTAAAGLSTTGRVQDAAFGDLNDDGMLDIVVSSDSGNAVFYNSRQRRFARATAAMGLGALPEGGALAIGDYDNDGYLDLFAGSSGSGRSELYLNASDARFTRDTRSDAALRELGEFTTRAAQFIDYDNDGHLDLIVVGEASSGGGVRLFHNDGTGRFESASERLPSGLPSAGAVSVADIDRDRDLDVLVAGSSGLRLLRNDGGNQNLSIQLRLTGLMTGSGKNNVFGIGSRVETRAGDLYQMRVVKDRVTMIGLGNHLKADVVRVEWPNGVPQTLYYPGSDQDVVENQVLKSSCGFLYAWDGTKYEFVTDVMWRSALGMPTGIGGSGSATFAPAAASREYLKIPRGALVAHNGRYRLQLTEELWETSYTDQVELVVVDHPDSVDVVVDERFVPPGPPVRLDLYHTRRERPPVSAVDDSGTNLLPALLREDDVFASNIDRDRYQGVMEPHDLILDLGDDLGDDQVLLMLRGWVFPTDASINVALSQGHGTSVMWPVLQVRDASGEWRTAIADLSIPSGKNKVIVADLTGKFPTADHHVRVRTNLQIYWDKVSVATNAARSPATVTSLKPVLADVHYRGFSRTYRKGGRYGPHWFDYQTVSTEPAWGSIVGTFTRYGDVKPLLTHADDEYIIMAPGDETTMQFDVAAAPPLPAGWTRDFFLYSVGWIKDGDFNTAHGGTVAPLPFHGMTRYPYGAGERYPTDRAHTQYMKTYNTRAVNENGSLRP